MYCNLLIAKKYADTILSMKNINSKSSIIRKVWSSVELLNKATLLQLNDADLTSQIMNQVERVSTLTSEDRQSLSDYIRAHVLLIRDIADSQI